jgi:hypothetical protein
MNRKNHSYLIISVWCWLVVINFSVSYAQPAVEIAPSNEPSWGEVSEGLQLSIRAEKEILTVCEPLVLHYFIRNVTNQTLTLNHHGFWADFHIILTDHAGKDFALPFQEEKVERERRGGVNVVQKLRGGQVYSYHPTRYEKIPYLTTTGTYLVALERHILKLERKQLLEKGESVNAKLLSNFIKIIVVESNKEGECYNRLMMFGPNKKPAENPKKEEKEEMGKPKK